MSALPVVKGWLTKCCRFGCVSAFDKKAAAAAVEELKSDPHACPELIEQLKELGLDKLE